MDNNSISNMFANTMHTLKGVRKVIPVNIRQFAGSALGDNSPLTEDDLWSSDLDAIKGAVGRNMVGQGTGEVIPGVIGYGDYGNKSGQFSDWQGGLREGVGPITTLIKSYTDPKFRMETTLGMAKFNTDPSGNTVVNDQYNWGASPEKIQNEIAKSGSKIKALNDAYRSAGFEGLLNAFGNLYIAPEGNTGAPVKINIGKINH